MRSTLVEPPATVAVQSAELKPQHNALVLGLAKHGVSMALVLAALRLAVCRNEPDNPLFVVIGTPMRGIRGDDRQVQHLTIWEIDAVMATGLRISLHRFSSDPRLRQIADDVEKIILAWAADAPVRWCRVMEARPEATKRRDELSPLSWFRNRSVELWGCGALGGYIAEMLARAGVRRLLLRDHGTVSPGLLVRQPFDDQQVGAFKASALRARLHRIRPELVVESTTLDILRHLDGEGMLGDHDLIIDSTASEPVAAKLERRLRDHGYPRPAIASMAISHDAHAGLLTLSQTGHPGGPADLARRAKLEISRRPRLRTYLDYFWPQESRTKPFQPEPGCSESTFVGSAADVMALASMMLNGLGKAASELEGSSRGAALLLSQDGTAPAQEFRWDPDFVLEQEGSDLQVRVSPSALREIKAWARASARTRDAATETGGMLFGEIDEAIGVIWVTEAEGPPPDSSASRVGFLCGVEGMEEANDEKRDRTRRSVTCIGSWHTHPNAVARPSAVDLGAAEILLRRTGTARKACVLLIAGGDLEQPTIGVHAFRRRSERVESIISTSGIPELECPPSRPIGLALSGGGSRAIAFHLGCLRGLHDRGLLDQVHVISGVSGGSVIAAMYAYSDDSFEEFDRRVTSLLATGLAGAIAKELARPSMMGRLLWTNLALATSQALATGRALSPSSLRGRLGGMKQPRAKPMRAHSRTDAFSSALRKRLLGRIQMGQVAREGLEVVINACDLRTGSAFRFGSKESGCWRLGQVTRNDVEVADAVAASAAYPALLPALDRILRFESRSGAVSESRAILTDGGVFENLGVGCMEPDRSASFSYNVFHPEYIVSCDAGAGLFGDSYPRWWPSRMIRSLEVMHRKVQDATRKRLHRYVETGAIKGFVLSYLGLRDESLPWIPADLVPRTSVFEYPTDFSAMTPKSIDLLARRGERLTRLLIAHYAPKL